MLLIMLVQVLALIRMCLAHSNSGDLSKPSAKNKIMMLIENPMCFDPQSISSKVIDENCGCSNGS